MSTQIDDGGPAFPGAVRIGMSLRDIFAAVTLHGMVSGINSEHDYQRLRGHAQAKGLSVSQWIAADAYKQADAMIAARKAK